MNSKHPDQSAKPLNAVVIVAAGRGSRMGNSEGGPKQYRFLNGLSVLQHTVNAFATCDLIDCIQVVIHRDDDELYRQNVTAQPKLQEPVIGGDTRQQSVLAGLHCLADKGFAKILIHDGARPFVDEPLIARVLGAVEPGCCVIPATAISETIKKANSDRTGVWVIGTVARDNLYLAQTPQGFMSNEIIDAHNSVAALNRHDFTDDAAVAEFAGFKVKLVAGNRENIKITTATDMDYANKINALNNYVKVPDIRTGNGYDIHRLVDGDTVILCGIEIDFNKKLDGHSDADVGLHALTDALLGTIGDGDIGSHFPPTDPLWRGAASDQFLAHACKLVRECGGIITHLDVTLICEMPKIGPHREKMRARIGQICDMEINRISVKATTNETIGSIGRSEGIAALATATVVIQA